MPYYGGGLSEYQRYAIYDFMYWELMRFGWEHGYKVFDFGRSKKAGDWTIPF
ncbi:MAG: GNAT family N-acetyltransferase [Nitrospirales bacterium]|nr:GNAT family N-acetyltransferase [Nitrospirales bacterium]